MRKQIIRQIDETGRIVLPKPFREMLGLDIRDEVILTLNNDTIVLRKFNNACAFCGEEHSFNFNGVLICNACAQRIGKLGEE